MKEKEKTKTNCKKGLKIKSVHHTKRRAFARDSEQKDIQPEAGNRYTGHE